MQIRTVFISDVHLGSRYSRTSDLLEFLARLKEERPQKIYLIGDFIDGWKLKRNWFWTNESNMVIRRLLKLANRGTEIYYISGNHDEFIREFVEDSHFIDFGNIHILNEMVHETVTGEKFLVVHGDLFDMVAHYAKWLCHLGDMGYSILLWLNKTINSIRKLFRMKHWSLSSAVKGNVKQAVNYISDFEKCIQEYSIERGCSGCVCGHIHSAALRSENGFTYANSGDWVESCTAIIEYEDGSLNLYRHGMPR